MAYRVGVGGVCDGHGGRGHEARYRPPRAVCSDRRPRYPHSPSLGMRGEVPRLAHEAVWAQGTSFPGGSDDAEIASLQQALAGPLRADLVDWLRVWKGDLIGPGGLCGMRRVRNVTDISSVVTGFRTGGGAARWLSPTTATAITTSSSPTAN